MYFHEYCTQVATISFRCAPKQIPDSNHHTYREKNYWRSQTIMFHLSYHGSKYISVCKLLHNHSRNGLEVEEYVCNYTSLSERCLISSKKGYPLPDPTTIKIFLSKRPISKYTKGRTFITKPGNPRCCRHNTNL